MMYKWSHWITCHNNEYEEHQHMKKRNQYYSQKSWKYRSQDKKNWSKKSLYRVFTKQQQWVKENHNHKKHEKINWKECTDKQCKKHYSKKWEIWWLLQETKYYVEEKKYH